MNSCLTDYNELIESFERVLNLPQWRQNIELGLIARSLGIPLKEVKTSFALWLKSDPDHD